MLRVGFPAFRKARNEIKNRPSFKLLDSLLQEVYIIGSNSLSF
jgi:hypothetical protein